MLICVDLDGTLLDTVPANAASYRAALEELGFTVTDEYYAERCNGGHYTRFLPPLMGGAPSAADVERVHDRKKALYSDFLDAVRPNTALMEILKTMRAAGHNLACVTTGSKQNATEVLEHFGVREWFGLIVTGEDVEKQKPDPEGYCRAMDDRLRNLFAKDPVGTIHGDLTIENIICRTDNDSWYLIDPNTGNLHESPFLDYGKLLQSLHGSYEFMMKTPRVAVQDNRIDFQLTRSAAYDALLAAVMEDLSARYPREQVESILMHEVIHWLRLMPYKLNKDRKRAAMFYAGLVMVANDVADFSEHKKETLC